jgi:hypothetical protein
MAGGAALESEILSTNVIVQNALRTYYGPKWRASLSLRNAACLRNCLNISARIRVILSLHYAKCDYKRNGDEISLSTELFLSGLFVVVCLRQGFFFQYTIMLFLFFVLGNMHVKNVYLIFMKKLNAFWKEWICYCPVTMNLKTILIQLYSFKHLCSGWRVSMTEILCSHVWKWKNDTCWNCSKKEEENDGGVESNLDTL